MQINTMMKKRNMEITWPGDEVVPARALSLVTKCSNSNSNSVNDTTNNGCV